MEANNGLPLPAFARHGPDTAVVDALHFESRILAAVGQPVMVSALDGRLIYWNRAAEEAYGWTAEEALGRLTTELLPSQGLDEKLEEITATLSAGQQWTGEFILQRRDGTWFPAIIADSPILDEKGHVVAIIGVVTDITERQATAAAHAVMSAIITSSRDAIAVVGTNGRITAWNDAAVALFSRSAEDAHGRRLEQATNLATSAPLRHAFGAARNGGTPRDFIARLAHADGTTRTLEMTVAPVRDHKGAVAGCSMIARDVSDRTRLAEAAAEDRRRLRDAQKIAHLGSFELDLQTEAVVWSDELYRILDIPLHTTPTAAAFRDRIHPEDRDRVMAVMEISRTTPGDHEVIHRIVIGDGTVRWIHVRMSSVDRRLGRLTGTIIDVTEFVALQQGLAHQAAHDALTGLPNRTSLEEHLTQSLEQGDPMALVLIDVDDFKWLNESLGHSTGDRALQIIGSRLEATVHGGDVVARFSGDLFAVACTHARGEAEASDLATSVLSAIREPLLAGGMAVGLRASAGVTYTDPGDPDEPTAADMLRNADVALFSAKESGKNQLKLFDETLRKSLARDTDREMALRRALSTKSVQVAYEPMVDMTDGSIFGAEALTRLGDGYGSWLPPEEVTAAAEQAGLLADLSTFVLSQACKEAARWRQLRPENPPIVSVNLAPSQLMDPRLRTWVEEALSAAALAPSLLCLEITETSLMVDVATSTRQLADLRRLGVHVAADDFGTGPSSLANLKRLPLRFIKADPSYVAGVGASHEDNAILTAITSLADALGLDVVAEGVVSISQVNELRRLGCRYAQGPFYGEPLDAAMFTASLMAGQSPDQPTTDQPASPGPARPDLAGAQAAGDAVRALAHEIRNPLTVAQGYAGLLRSNDDPSVAKSAATIHRATERIARILTYLDDVSSVDAGTIAIDTEVTDLNQLVTQVLADFRETRPNREVLWTKPGPAWADVDQARLSQALLNLVTNADKFSPPDQPIELSLSTGHTHVLTVRDHGPGVALDEVGQIFRKFARLDQSKPGSGLGLYLARGIARAHGGDITYRPWASGAEFALSVPKAKS